MAEDCLFCKIASDEISSRRVVETRHAVVFHDLHPKAPVHLLVIPKAHIATLNDLTPENAGVMGDLFLAAKMGAEATDIAATGYRTVFNCGRDAQMEIAHLHLHVLGGRAMTWPPG